jgi:hypothetical protein
LICGPDVLIHQAKVIQLGTDDLGAVAGTVASIGGLTGSTVITDRGITVTVVSTGTVAITL